LPADRQASPRPPFYPVVSFAVPLGPFCLFAFWQGLRMRQLKTGAPPNYISS